MCDLLRSFQSLLFLHYLDMIHQGYIYFEILLFKSFGLQNPAEALFGSAGIIVKLTTLFEKSEVQKYRIQGHLK